MRALLRHSRVPWPGSVCPSEAQEMLLADRVERNLAQLGLNLPRCWMTAAGHRNYLSGTQAIYREVSIGYGKGTFVETSAGIGWRAENDNSSSMSVFETNYANSVYSNKYTLENAGDLSAFVAYQHPGSITTNFPMALFVYHYPGTYYYTPTSAYPGFAICLDTTPADQVKIYAGLTTTTTVLAPAETLPRNQINTIGIVIRASYIDLYINGVRTSMNYTAYTRSPVNASSVRYSIGYIPYGGSWYSGATYVPANKTPVIAAGAWNYKFTSGQMETLHNHWATVTAENFGRRYWTVLTVDGEVGPAEVMGASTIGSVTLTQAHTLAGVANFTGASSVGAVVLDPSYNVPGGNVTGASSVGAVVLTQVHTLVVDDVAGAGVLQNGQAWPDGIDPAGNLDTPTGVIATPGDTSIRVDWTAVAYAETYMVYWSRLPGAALPRDFAAETADTWYLLSGLTNGLAHYITVVAKSTSDNSLESAEVMAIPQAPVSGRRTNWIT